MNRLSKVNLRPNMAFKEPAHDVSIDPWLTLGLETWKQAMADLGNMIRRGRVMERRPRSYSRRYLRRVVRAYEADLASIERFRYAPMALQMVEEATRRPNVQMTVEEFLDKFDDQLDEARSYLPAVKRIDASFPRRNKKKR